MHHSPVLARIIRVISSRVLCGLVKERHKCTSVRVGLLGWPVGWVV